MSLTKTKLPDITNQTNTIDNQPLEWVGMENIGIPLQVPLSGERIAATSAQADVFVSLDTAAKGIHMSRLYLELNERLANQAVNADRLNGLLDACLQSHHDISGSAMIKLTFDLPLLKPALLSDNAGYQAYPVTVTQSIVRGEPQSWLELTIPYSSTCPCSNSLANQLNAQALASQFPDETLSKSDVIKWLSSKQAALATPHNQRSYAYLKLQLQPGHWPDIDELIFDIEAAIGTPVQTAVKREDEQEFARLNGANLLFCEDAARRIKHYLESLSFVPDYWYKVEHQESLHAHNAVVIDRKNTASRQ